MNGYEAGSVGGYGLRGAQGFYTLESLEASHQQHHLYPPGASYALPSDGTVPPGSSYALDRNSQQEKTTHDHMPAYHYHHQQQGHMGLAAQGSYGSAQADLVRAGGLLHSDLPSYGRDSSLYPRLAPGSIPPPRYPPVEQYVPQEGHTPWYRNGSSSSSSVLQQQQSSFPFSAGAEFRPSLLSLPNRGTALPFSKSQVPTSGFRGTAKKKMGSQFKHGPAFRRNNSMTGPPKPRQPVVSGSGGPGWCSICEIECNSKEVLETHCEGRKHKRRLQMKEGLLAFQKKVNEKHLQLPGKGIIDENLKKDNKNNMHIPLVSIQTSAKTKQTDLSDIKSQADQEQTVTGEMKHLDTNQNEGGEADAKAPVSNQRKRKQKAKAADSVDTKRQRLLDAGTAISELKVCTLCHTVCNSQIVFNSHLAGKKHKRLEEAANAVSQGNKVAEEANAVTAGNETKEEATADSQRNTTEEETSSDSQGSDSDNECTADGDEDGEDEKAD